MSRLFWRDNVTGEYHFSATLRQRWDDQNCCDLCAEGEQEIAWHDEQLKLCKQHAIAWGRLPREEVVDE